MYDTNDKTPESELKDRIQKLQIQLEENGIDAALILQKADLFYLSGTIQESHLYVPVDGEPLLMVRKTFDRALAESPLQHVAPFNSPKQIPDFLREYGLRLPDTLGMELDVLPANFYFNYQSIFETSKIVDIAPAIRSIRSVKSQYEIDLICQAAKLSDRVAGCVPNILHEGMTELELAGKIEAEARRLGHQGLVRMRLWGSEMFYGHLLSGPVGAVPSFLSSPTGGMGVSPAIAQGPGFKTIQRHEPVLVDYVFVYNGYLSDHARIFSLGPLPDELMQAHAAMLEIQGMIKKIARPGIQSGEIYDRALARTEEFGYGDSFMGADRERIHFVGHGIGLEVDEYPFLATGQRLELQEGMTIALEPKLIFPGKGVVGIENTHVVTQEGLEQLGKFPDDVVVI
ncbi:MAG: aminopeptidase P family protein [Desulfobacterales bacterium]|nr:aminopeptidase P family protein [Desulfobacterales bacterium]